MASPFYTSSPMIMTSGSRRTPLLAKTLSSMDLMSSKVSRAVGNPPGRAFSKAGEFVGTVEFIKAFAARKFFNILPAAQAAIPELGPVAHLLHDGADAEAVDGIPVLSHDIVDVKANIGKACNESIEARHGPRTVCEELVRMGPVRFKEFPR